ncbi:sigma-70 family RNA polymerase sigma factor [Rhizobium sp. LjRoot98]|uniref:RNA polymerase sigma factor n=1 Tax=unclassified Rhizobium TaxID=2613769 RepID=UPI00071594D2|nr:MULTISPECIES: sigma-70 family RNA polymerase sigma factor [unclassified Rhizobium]KQV34862.1 RNA polymerase subunit sigma-70 [Rhizobium sp. Root1204]KQY00525.1 RNA polymerase subunit sigma-70 [Rhizobium sp. Root1334]KRC11709.1 RNA polymerase subunit sigma-70 [Rhizobium sp. Root73]
MIDVETRHAVYIANRTALIAYAMRILGSREVAEDVVQDAFLRFAPANRNTGTPAETLAYLYKIVRNLCFDFLKRQKIEIREKQTEPPFWSIPTTAPTPEDFVVVADEVKQIARVLSDLPADIRIALEMHRFGGYNLEEIAAYLDISVATAHRHVRTAMLRVATMLMANAS